MQLLPSKIKHALGLLNPLPYIQSFFRSEIREEILKAIDIHLLYFDGRLISLETHSELLVDFNSQEIAQASKKLIENDKVNSKLNKKDLEKKLNRTSIAVFLPLTNFAYSKYSMPSVDNKNITAALNYQRDEFLPTSSDDLQLTVNHLKQENNFALWFSKQRTEEFYLAFKQQGLILSSIHPSFTLLASKSETTIRELSLDYTAQYNFSEYGVAQLGHIATQDIKIPAFKEEWEANFGPLNNSIQEIKSKDDWLNYLAANRYEELLKQTKYAYFPDKIKTQFKSRGYLRNSRVIGLLIFILLFMLAIPFVENERKHWREEKKYQKYNNLAKNVLNNRATVLSNEEEWGLYLNYPQVDALGIITRLNKIIPLNSWISSFKIKNGYIEIDGYSPNPTAILELISAQPDFNEVAFNKNTRTERGKTKERFGITFHIKDLNITEYEKKYFGDDR